MKKFKWVLLGMFTQEMVVYTAWSQWMSAKRLSKVVDKYNEEQVKENVNAKTVEWSLTHSFFAQMGGLAIETKDPEEPAFIKNSPRMYITANGAAMLAEIGRLPNLSKKFIQDKSKADGLAKALVITQASWLIVEVIGRAIAKLPITLLEVNTFAHVVCALIMYVLWWHKPLDIREPLVLEGEWTRSLCAAMWMFSRVSSEMEQVGPGLTVKYPEIESILHYQQNVQPEQSNMVTASASQQSGMPLMLSSKDTLALTAITTGVPVEVGADGFIVDGIRQPFNTYFDVPQGRILFPFGFAPKSSSYHFRKRYIELSRWHTPSVELTVSEPTLQRWILATKCFKEYPEIWDRFRRQVNVIQSRDGGSWTVSEYPRKLCNKNFVDPRIQNWPGKDLITSDRKYHSKLFFAVCVCIYGGIHAAAWNHYFPSSVEQFVWRLSTIYITASAVLFPLDNLVEKLFRRYRILNRILLPWYTIVRVLAVVYYILFRIFLVGLAFISFRALPRAMYETPRWSQYLSHL